MLVLARKAGQWIQIGGPNAEGGIQVKILSIKGGVVRLGIAAPGEVEILRGPELADHDGNTNPGSETDDV